MDKIVQKMFGVLILLTSNFVYGADPSESHLNVSKLFTSLWGKAPENSLYAGSLLYYVAVKEWPRVMYRPYFGLTYKSISVVYAKGCDNDNLFAAGIQRNLYTYSQNSNQLSVGYRVSITYGGWCYDNGDFKTASKCNGILPILPMIMPFLEYNYKHVGLELGFLGKILILNAVYHFDEH